MLSLKYSTEVQLLNSGKMRIMLILDAAAAADDVVADEDAVSAT